MNVLLKKWWYKSLNRTKTREYMQNWKIKKKSNFQKKNFFSKFLSKFFFEKKCFFWKKFFFWKFDFFLFFNSTYSRVFVRFRRLYHHFFSKTFNFYIWIKVCCLVCLLPSKTFLLCGKFCLFSPENPYIWPETDKLNFRDGVFLAGSKIWQKKFFWEINPGSSICKIFFSSIGQKLCSVDTSE